MAAQQTRIGNLLPARGWLPGAKLQVVVLLAALVFPLALPQSAEAGEWTYSVRPDDSLWRICNEYVAGDSCWRRLAEYNGFDEPGTIQPGTVVRIPFEWLKEQIVAAEVIHVVGHSFIQPEAEDQRQAQVGDNTYVGYIVRVGEGFLTLRFADGSTLSMNPNSELRLDSVTAFKQSRPYSVEVSLPRGGVKVVVPVREPRTRFKVGTPAGAAAVRGTVFRLDSEVDDVPVAEMRGEILEGVVSVSHSKQSRDIEAGYGVVAREGASLEPAALLAAPEWNQECNDPGYVAWQNQANAARYSLALLEDSEEERVLRRVEVASNNYFFEGLEEKCYRVNVSATGSQGLNGFENQRRLCYEILPESPKIIRAMRRGEQLSISWLPASGAAQYIVELADNSEFASIAVSTTVTGTQYQASHEGVDGMYARVVAVSEDGKQSLQGDVAQVEDVSENRWWIGVLAALALFAIL